ncbi:trigger factor family protein, partial [candidate division WWE3 bacterium]|nr:trigger factor family protein [candidate division WWE3 bacterium]
MKIERNDLKDQEIQFTITASADDITNAKDQALEFLGKEINVPGFRKGKAPAKEIRSRVGELRLLQEAIEILVDLGYRQVLTENKELFPLVEPRIDIKDEDSLIAEESQFVFDLIITNRPEVT